MESDELDVTEIEENFKSIQNFICNFLQENCGQKYAEDCWKYEKGKGGGITRIWEGNDQEALEKAGVNFSSISGRQLPTAATAQMTIDPNTEFHATGVSLVIHPRNPSVPTIHMNVRYFGAGKTWWFGGGIDLTPYSPLFSQIVTFHKTLKEICTRNGQPYEEYKKTCDDYFFLKHRAEMRGVGGIFFDQLTTSDKVKLSKRQIWNFVQDLGRSFVDLYKPFITKERQQLPFTEAQREFQLVRRSRYVEFNLLYDRGTKFGLQSEGRTESILMSLPSVAVWKYNWTPKPDSDEEKVVKRYLHPQDWTAVSREEDLK